MAGTPIETQRRLEDIPVEERQRTYLAERRFRRLYDEALEQRVLQALDPVFDRERVKPDVRKQLGEILFGADAKIQLSVPAVEALYGASLLVANESSTEQLNDPGWTDWATSRPGRFRIYSYIVGLQSVTPVTDAEKGLKLEAERTGGKRDFTHWVLSRHHPR